MRASLIFLELVLGSTAWAADGAKNAEAFQATKQFTQDMLGQQDAFGGKVIDKIDVSNYTYVQFAHGKEQLWLATSKTDVKKGDLVSFANAQTMHNFHSKVLNRTFDEIYFVSELTVKR